VGKVLPVRGLYSKSRTNLVTEVLKGRYQTASTAVKIFGTLQLKVIYACWLASFVKCHHWMIALKI
jgi:hypothetical protein